MMASNLTSLSFSMSLWAFVRGHLHVTKVVIIRCVIRILSGSRFRDLEDLILYVYSVHYITILSKI